MSEQRARGTVRGPAPLPIEETIAYLTAVMGESTSGRYLEVRFRRGGGMGQLFFGADHPQDAARVIVGLGTRTDVYVGVAPRTIPAGDRAAVASTSVVWADCDTASATARLAVFDPPPALVVRSGSPGACHAYWLLEDAMRPEAIERVNRRLAFALGADPQSVDAARVLRPPGTRNFKHEPPAPVDLEQAGGGAVDVRRLVGALPDVPQPATTSRRSSRAPRAADRLLTIEPAHYVRALLGLEVGRDGKVRCPFHDDRSPSLHVYREPARGWHCFGCGRGGSIYDLGACLWGLETRGADFLTLRQRLLRTLGF